MSIVVIVPVLGRAEKLASIAEDLRVASPECRLVFVCSFDRDMDIASADDTGADVLIADWTPGPADFANKMLLGYQRTTEEWIFQGATDVEFQPSWAKAALRRAEETDAKVIGTNDMANPMVTRKGRHSTHTLIARDYIDDPGATFDGPGTIFATAYDHQSVDVELIWLAQQRRVWAFARDAIVRHRHPFFDRSVPMDDTYRKGLEHGRADAELFARRKRTWERSQS